MYIDFALIIIAVICFGITFTYANDKDRCIFHKNKPNTTRAPLSLCSTATLSSVCESKVFHFEQAFKYHESALKNELSGFQSVDQLIDHLDRKILKIEHAHIHDLLKFPEVKQCIEKNAHSSEYMRTSEQQLYTLFLRYGVDPALYTIEAVVECGTHLSSSEDYFYATHNGVMYGAHSSQELLSFGVTHELMHLFYDDVLVRFKHSMNDSMKALYLRTVEQRADIAGLHSRFSQVTDEERMQLVRAGKLFFAQSFSSLSSVVQRWSFPAHFSTHPDAAHRFAYLVVAGELLARKRGQ